MWWICASTKVRQIEVFYFVSYSTLTNFLLADIITKMLVRLHILVLICVLSENAWQKLTNFAPIRPQPAKIHSLFEKSSPAFGKQIGVYCRNDSRNTLVSALEFTIVRPPVKLRFAVNVMNYECCANNANSELEKFRSYD